MLLSRHSSWANEDDTGHFMIANFRRATETRIFILRIKISLSPFVKSKMKQSHETYVLPHAVCQCICSGGKGGRNRREGIRQTRKQTQNNKHVESIRQLTRYKTQQYISPMNKHVHCIVLWSNNLETLALMQWLITGLHDFLHLILNQLPTARA
jgi:hypothetical protein